MKRICFFLMLFLPLASCKKFLETKPTDFVTPEFFYNTPDQLQIALNGVYDKIGTHNVYGAYITYWLVASNDETYLKATTDLNMLYSYNSTSVYVAGFWQAVYIGIERANLLLANIDKPTMTDDARALIKGQALFLRGYFHFLLAENFGDVPLITKPTSSVFDVNVPRTPLKDVYAQVLIDMTQAEQLLQKQTATSLGYAGKVSKTAVEGILARVCLTMAGKPLNDVSKYKDAMMWAQKVVDSKEHSLNPDYKQIFINLAQDKYDIKESIWEAEEYGNSTGGFLEGSQAMGNFIGIRAFTTDPRGSSEARLYASKKVFDAYGLNPATSGTVKSSFDIRRDWNCPNVQYTGTNGAPVITTSTWLMSTGKFRREYTLESPKDKNFTPINVPLLRYTDVLLMLAEADNELNGPTATAIHNVNQIRRRGYGKDLDNAKGVAGERVKAITVTNGGSGYSATNLPTVTITGGGGSGATATATVAGGKITSILLNDMGTFYTSNPTITISGGVGSGAAATATITAITDADLLASQTADKDSFRKAIQDERMMELFTEGERKYDLIRWGIFISTMKAMIDFGKANAAPTAFYISYQNVSDKNVLLPIPSHEMGLNNALKQNPGW